MNKKILITVTLMLAITMLATPLVTAKPGSAKNNDKFAYFQLVISGAADTETGTQWYTPPGATADDFKTSHVRDRIWEIGDDLSVTIGEMTIGMGDLSYYATFDADTVAKEDKDYAKVRVTETITVFSAGEEIGTFEISVRDMTTADGYAGTFVGYGTGVFEGAKITGIDEVQVTIIPGTPPEVILTIYRTGTIMGLP